MELYIEKQLQTVLYSFILGLIFGGLYDIIRMIHILCGIASYDGKSCDIMKRGKIPFVLFFVFDTVYALAVTAIFSVFQYWQMNGRFRLFVLLSAVVGFVVWYRTAGRVVMALSEAVVRFIKSVFLRFVVLPVRFCLKCLFCAVRFAYRMTVKRAVRLTLRGLRAVRSNRIKKKLDGDIRFSETEKQRKYHENSVT